MTVDPKDLPAKFIWMDLEVLRERRRQDGLRGALKMFEEFFNEAWRQVNAMDREEGRGLIEIPRFLPPKLKG